MFCLFNRLKALLFLCTWAILHSWMFALLFPDINCLSRLAWALVNIFVFLLQSSLFGDLVHKHSEIMIMHGFILFDENWLFLRLQNGHQFFDLRNSTFLGFILIDIGQWIQDGFDILNFPIDHAVNLFLETLTVPSKLGENDLIVSQGELRPIRSRVYRLLIWYSERKI